LRILRFALFLIVGLASAAARADGQVRWKGLTIEGGSAPVDLEEKLRVYLPVALRQLNLELTSGDAFVAEASVGCQFEGGAARAHCVVRARSDSGREAQRGREVRYQVGEDLAQSIALLVADALVVDLQTGRLGPLPPGARPRSHAVVPEPARLAPEPPPAPTPTPPVEEPVTERGALSMQPPLEPPSSPAARAFIFAGGGASAGLQGAPSLWGGSVEILRALGPWLLVGADLGSSWGSWVDAFRRLDFVRTHVAAVVGLQLEPKVFRVQARAGVGAFWLRSMLGDPVAKHDLIAPLGLVALRAHYPLSRSIWVGIDLRLLLLGTKEEVVSEGAPVVTFGYLSPGATLELAYAW
jgi:hypothetical protein